MFLNYQKVVFYIQMSTIQKWEKVESSQAWIVVSFFIATWLLIIGTEWYHYLIGILLVINGLYSAYRRAQLNDRIKTHQHVDQ